jgi:hypothetical protein
VEKVEKVEKVEEVEEVEKLKSKFQVQLAIWEGGLSSDGCSSSRYGRTPLAARRSWSAGS